MYDYLDRRLYELPLQARLAVVGLRLWARAAMTKECPMTAVRTLFCSHSLLIASQPAHDLFYWLGTRGRKRFQLGCENCGSVSEDEALLLTAMFSPDEACAEHSMSALISEESLAGAVMLARRLSASLGPARAVDERARH